MGINGSKAEGAEGAKEVEEAPRWAGGGNEEEQRWRRGKGEPSKHFPVHFSSGGLN